MDKTDVEILLALKSDHKFHKIDKIEQLGNNLTERKQLLERLKILLRNGYVGKQYFDSSPYFIITQKGEYLI